MRKVVIFAIISLIMSAIDITTTHNIVVSYELATPIQRVLATIIDGVIIFLYCVAIATVFSWIMPVMLLLILPVVFCYHLVMEIYNEGQSIGKRLLKLRVVSLEGLAPSMESYFQRWIFRMVDISATSGLLALFWVNSTERSQRLGDLVAGTTVIQVSDHVVHRLQSLRELSQREHEIQYPLVAQYTDKDMLLIKEALQRYRSKRSPANAEVVKNLRKKLLDDMNLTADDLNGTKTMDFLSRVLLDYIHLTR